MPAATSRTNPTKLREKFDAGSAAVCTIPGKVAIHLYTTEGEILVHMRERDYLRSFRGSRDHNGVPFRTLEQLDEAKRREEEAASLPPPVEKPKQIRPYAPRKSRLSDGVIALMQQIYAIDLAPHRRGAIAEACRHRGVAAAQYYSWRQGQRRAVA